MEGGEERWLNRSKVDKQVIKSGGLSVTERLTGRSHFVKSVFSSLLQISRSQGSGYTTWPKVCKKNDTHM